MKETLNMTDVIDYLTDFWIQKLAADKKHDLPASEKLMDEFFAMEDLVAYCLEKDKDIDERRLAIISRIDTRIVERLWDRQSEEN